MQRARAHIRYPNPNHHLVNQQGMWWIGFYAYPTPTTILRIRKSLHTKDLAEARTKRDAIFAKLETEEGRALLDAELERAKTNPTIREIAARRRYAGLLSLGNERHRAVNRKNVFSRA